MKEEAKIQAAILMELSVRKPGLCVFAIPNGGKRDKKTAVYLKSIGVRPGPTDIFCAYVRHGYGGLWMEVKAPGGKLSKAQLRFKEFITHEYLHVEVDNVKEGVDTVMWYVGETYHKINFYEGSN